MTYYDQHKDHVLKILHSSEKGISTNEANLRLEQFGYNNLQIKRESLIKKIIEIFFLFIDFII